MVLSRHEDVHCSIRVYRCPLLDASLIRLIDNEIGFISLLLLQGVDHTIIISNHYTSFCGKHAVAQCFKMHTKILSSTRDTTKRLI